MNISWKYSGGAVRRVYGKAGLFLFLACGLGWTAFACPYPEDIDINLKTVCVGMYSLVSFSTEPGDTNFSITTTEVTTVPDPSAGAQVIDDGMTVVWNEAGKYSVAITVKITSTAATVPVPAIREASVTKTVTVVKVDSISTNSDLSATTYPICVTNGSTVTFYAKPDPSDIEEWPAGKPVWGEAASGSGDHVDVIFNTPGINYVTAECGNTVKVAVFVITNYTIVASSTNIALSNTVTAVAWTLNEQGAPVTIASDWTIPEGNDLAEFVGNANGVDTVTIKGIAASSEIGDVQVHAEASGNPALADDEWFTVVKVEITPSAMNATESLDSGTFTCTVTPSGLSPTYQWLTGSDNDAWPATAGNDPELDYSASTASATIVNGTRWFAPTPDRRQVEDGEICYYNINCEITVDGVKCRASTPAILSVTVDMSGQTVGCVFQNWDTITVAETGGIWKVAGQGNFSRSAPVASVNMPSTSQFYDKAMVHENKHVEQWMTGMFKDLKDANALYSSTLSTLTSTNSEADLRSKILTAVYDQSVADDAIYDSKECDAEKEAFDAMNAVAPDFLEMDDADWKPLYGCQ